ncbi:MAG: HEAT repeat domain-containing protein [Burkholderiales bacterium]|nr:HEAT repeat domain-containing protein [Anaerolineae bacterium]
MSKDFQADLHEVLSWRISPPDTILAKCVEITREAGIKTYDDLFRVIRSNRTEPELRAAACQLLGKIGSMADKRRTSGPLIDALKSDYIEVRTAAASSLASMPNPVAIDALLAALQKADTEIEDGTYNFERLWILSALGNIENQRAVAPLIDIAHDKQRDGRTRNAAIRALMGNSLGIDALIQIMIDESEEPQVRGDATEALGSARDGEAERVLPLIITALSHPLPDLRFWASFALTDLLQAFKNPEIFITFGALAALNRIATDDKIILPGWWAVRDEAIAAIEYCHHRLRTKKRYSSPNTHFLGPVLGQDQQWTRTPSETQPESFYLPTFTTWSMTVDEFMKHMRKRWKRVKFNMRQPAADYLLIDFEFKFSGKLITGGLQRNGYTLTINGERRAIIQFALWWKTIVPPEHTLYLDAWTDGYADLDRFSSEAEIHKALSTYRRGAYDKEVN